MKIRRAINKNGSKVVMKGIDVEADPCKIEIIQEYDGSNIFYLRVHTTDTTFLLEERCDYVMLWKEDLKRLATNIIKLIKESEYD